MKTYKRNQVQRQQGEAAAAKARAVEMRARFDAGATWDDIGAEFDISGERVRNILKRYGLYERGGAK